MQIENFRASKIANDLVQKRARFVDQSCAHFFDQIFALDRLCQLFFRGGQNAFETNDNQIFDDIDVRFFRAAAHVVDLELDDGATNFCFDFPFGFHAQAAVDPSEAQKLLNLKQTSDYEGQFIEERNFCLLNRALKLKHRQLSHPFYATFFK